MPSQSSRLISEYVNIRISELRRSKIIQERYNNRDVATKCFVPIGFFASVDIYFTKFIIPETARFSAKLIHHEEKSNSPPENIPNFTNPLVSNIEEVNATFTFNESTSQPDRMDFVEAKRK